MSGEAARSYFARIVAAAQAKDFDTLCRLSASVGTCEAELHSGKFAFLNAPASNNDHDIAFFSIGDDAALSNAGTETVGLEGPLVRSIARCAGH